MTSGNIPQHVSEVDMAMRDTRAGWASVRLCVDGAPYDWAFSLVVGNPLSEIRRFAEALGQSKSVSMRLEAEPGRIIFAAEPTETSDVVCLEVLTGWPREKLFPEVVVLCWANTLRESMYKNIAFLASHSANDSGS